MSKRQKKQPLPVGRSPQKPWYKNIRNIIIIVCAFAIVAVGAWSLAYFPSKPYRQPAIQAGDTIFDLRYFTNMLKTYYGSVPLGTTISDFADYVEEQILEAEKIILGSKALGIEIPRSDIEQKLEDSGQDVTRERVDVLMAETLLDQQVPAEQPQYNIQAMLLENEKAAQAVVAMLEAGDNFTAVSASLSKYPSDSIDPAGLGWVTPRQADLTLGSTEFGDMIANGGVGTVNGPVFDASVTKVFGYWVAKVVEKGFATDNVTPKIRVEGILLGTEQAAKDILDELDAGADFNELAKQSSQAPGAATTGAELGWLYEIADPGLFQTLAEGPMDTVIGPVSDNLTQTTGGYWVYTITEKEENRALTDDQLSMLQNDVLAKFAAALAEDPVCEIKSLLTQEMKDLALNEAVLAQGAGSVLIGTVSLPIGEAGIEYYHKFKIYGEQKGNTWSIESGMLPEGLVLDTVNGVISGTPKNGGGGGFTIKVGNSLHYDTVELTYTIYIPITITTASLPDGQTGTVYSQLLDAFSGIEYPAWTVVQGSLPDGLTLSQTGMISGTPTTAGTFSFTVQVDDGVGKTTRDLTISIK